MDKKAILSLDLGTGSADDLFRALCLGSRVDYNAFCSDGSVSFITDRLGIHKSGNGTLEGVTAEEILYDGITYMLGRDDVDPVTEGGHILLGRDKGQMNWDLLLKAETGLAGVLGRIYSKEMLCDIKGTVKGCIPESYRADFEKHDLGMLVNGNGDYDICSVKTLIDMTVCMLEAEYRKSSAIVGNRLRMARNELEPISITDVAYRNEHYSSVGLVDRGMKRVLRKRQAESIGQTLSQLCLLFQYVSLRHASEVENFELC